MLEAPVWSETADSPSSTRPSSLHGRARRRMLVREHGGWFRSDWLNAGFVHLEVDGDWLQRMTPFEIDRFHGRAFVSLVAFDMRMFRPRGTGAIGAACMACAARHGLLNVRTYVRHRGEPGICFLTEWIPNPLSALLGPRMYGLPYRLANLDYRMDARCENLSACVQAHGQPNRVRFNCTANNDSSWREAEEGSLDEFLLERYTAFTFGHPRGKALKFRVWHEPWMQRPATVEMLDRSLLSLTHESLRAAAVVGGNLSPGVRNVWIGRPRAC